MSYKTKYVNIDGSTFEIEFEAVDNESDLPEIILCGETVYRLSSGSVNLGYPHYRQINPERIIRIEEKEQP